MKGLYNLNQHFKNIGTDNCFISEITLAELKYGVENSKNPGKNQLALNNFITEIQILPIFQALDVYAKEKARLKKAGTIIDDFDLLIGSTAVSFDLMMVTNNTNHFTRITDIKLEDWTQ